ncbi:MAG: hypothetical protein RMM28_11930, partial [Thermoleophilia bacterium]|nr:hypothetical protein [Gaiellaceae bacterium]MDW8339836.1 hypothetical protein [Thermoleophilia bacterium]
RSRRARAGVVRNGHLAGDGARPRHGHVRWRRPEPVLDAGTLNDLIRILMRIEAKREDVPELLREDDDEE